jgi:hypothetical protein
MNTIITRITELQDSGMTNTKIKAFLTIEDYSAKDITAAFKELGLIGTKPKTFASEYYDWLATEHRLESEAEDYIAGLGEFGETSKNVKAHKSHYLNIRELAALIWCCTATEETDEQIEIKAAWALHRKLTAKLDDGKNLTKAEKSKCHPDKVSYLNNSELTAAYNELSKRAA